MKIIIDAMGGDNAPQVPVEAGVKAVKERDLNIIFTGDRAVLEKELSKFEYDEKKIEIVDCKEVISNDEEPVKAVRKKRDSSMVVGAKLLYDGVADAMFSMGSTGALLTAGLFEVGRIKGVHRPAIATMIPTGAGGKLLIDAGANTNCKAQNLLEFAVMGNIYMNKIEGVKNPKIGLVNNGTEEEKGNNLTKETYRILKNNPYNMDFIGNIEGREFMEGDADVIVCDGFVGNVILKTLEGMGKVVGKNVKDIFSGNVLKKIGALCVFSELKAFKKKMDYREYGGAPIMGLKKTVIKGHGASDVKAAYIALTKIEKFVKEDITGDIERILGKEV